MISIRPDPSRPRGGYAEVSVAADQLPEDNAQLAVFDNYSERYLGRSGWQPTRAVFGPYMVTRDKGRARFVIGPEIVNQIEEFANVKLIIGELREDIGWPDDVVPAPGAAEIGGLMTGVAADAGPENALAVKTEEVEEVTVAEAPAEPAQVVVETAQEARRFGPWLGLLAMVVLAVGLAYWFLFLQDTAVAPGARTAETEDTGPCSFATLKKVAGFDMQLSALKSCGSSVEADVALKLLEQAAAADDAEALLLFGMAYDGQAEVEIVEDKIGMTFGDIPATAAEYYARAVSSGSVDAGEKLASICARMVEMTDTLTQSAVADYCKE